MAYTVYSLLYRTYNRYFLDVEYFYSGVRLSGGSGPYEGTVELNINGQWGTICDDSFDIKDGDVICKMAGYQRYFF